jgi:heterodisulfide reductase subunit A-like polyferredoxin/coenzyme F420-reducing hydrogenase delta subunit
VIKKIEQNGDVGVVLCDCGGTLRDQLDFEKLQKHLEQLPAVTAVSCSSKFCRQKDCTKAIERIAKKQTKRLVIGACDEEVFDKSLRQMIADGTLNEGLLWCVNIREHCGWVTSKPTAATNKAKEILTAAVRRVTLAKEIKSKKATVNQDVLVLGAGPAAMQTAVGLSQLGHKVNLVTKEDSLGGQTAETPGLYAYLASDRCEAEALVKSRVGELVGRVIDDKQIAVQTDASLKSIKGEFGNFNAVVNSNGTEESFTAGAIVLAADSTHREPELAKIIYDGEDIPKRVAIIIDVIAEQGKAVSAQVLSAAEVLVKQFGTEVKLYCHNVRVATAGLENLYRRAREGGVVILKYESLPVISERGTKKQVCVQEPTTGYEVSEEFDRVIMADALTAGDNDGLLSSIEGLRAGPEGTLQADNVWLLPTKTNREGIFVAGSAGGTDELRTAQGDGLAAANQIHELLKDRQTEVLDDAAIVDDDKCVLCLTCMRICPHSAVSVDIDNKAALVSSLVCQRCGICAAQCPADAIELPRYTDEEIAAEVGDKPKLTVFACENSAYPAATAAGLSGLKYAADIRLIRIPCAGKVDPREILQALECGADKVMILGCHPESCQYLHGSTRAARRVEWLNSALEKAGVDGKRVVWGPLASVEPGKFLEYVKK